MHSLSLDEFASIIKVYVLCLKSLQPRPADVDLLFSTEVESQVLRPNGAVAMAEEVPSGTSLKRVKRSVDRSIEWTKMMKEVGQAESIGFWILFMC